jgi:hypothetical protein
MSTELESVLSLVRKGALLNDYTIERSNFTNHEILQAIVQIYKDVSRLQVEIHEDCIYLDNYAGRIRLVGWSFAEAHKNLLTHFPSISQNGFPALMFAFPVSYFSLDDFLLEYFDAVGFPFFQSNTVDAKITGELNDYEKRYP